MSAVYLIGGGQMAMSKNGGVRRRYSVADAIEQAIYHAGINADWELAGGYGVSLLRVTKRQAHGALYGHLWG